MPVIDKLTPEQEAQIPVFVQKWVDQASTPTNRAEATDAIKKLYSHMGEDEPLVIFGRSPNETVLLAILVMCIAKGVDWKGNQLDNQLHNQLRNQLYNQLSSQLSSQLDNQLDNQLRNQLRNESDKNIKSMLTSLRATFYEHDYWLVWSSWYDFGQYIGVEFDKEALDLFLAFNRNVGLTIPYKGVVFMSDRPTKIQWENGQLHNEYGKSIEYADGFGYYNLRGINLPEDIYKQVLSGEFGMGDLMKANLNADQRAVAIQFLEAEKLLDGLGAELVHTGTKQYEKAMTSQMRVWLRFSGETVPRGPLSRALIEKYNEAHRTKLYKVENFAQKVLGEDNGDNTTEYCMVMAHPTVYGKHYIEWVEPKIGKQKDADLAQAVAFGFTKEQYLEAEEA